MKFSRLLKISRPRFWLYELGAYAVGLSATYAAGIFSTTSIVPVIIFFLYFTFPANLLIYGINDIFDYETDIKNPKKTGYEDVLQPRDQKYVWKWIALTNLPFIGSLFFFTHAFGAIFLSLIAFIFFASFYSAFPIRGKIRPGLDAFFSASHYIATAVFAFYLSSQASTKITWPYVIAGICWAMAMHAYSAIPDIKADAESGIKTIATKLGEKGTVMFCFLLYGASSIITFQALPSLRNSLIALLVLPYFLMMFKTFHAVEIKDKDSKETRIFKLYKYFPILNAVVGFLLFWIIALVR